MPTMKTWIVLRRVDRDKQTHVQVQAASATAAFNRACGGPRAGSHAEETTFDSRDYFGQTATVVYCVDTGKVHYVISVEHG